MDYEKNKIDSNTFHILNQDVSKYSEHIEVMEIIRQNFEKFRGITYIPDNMILRKLKENMLRLVLFDLGFTDYIEFFV